MRLLPQGHLERLQPGSRLLAPSASPSPRPAPLQDAVLLTHLHSVRFLSAPKCNRIQKY